MYNDKSYWGRYFNLFSRRHESFFYIGRQHHWIRDVYTLQDNIGVGAPTNHYSATGVPPVREIGLDTRSAAHEILYILTSANIPSKLFSIIQRESIWPGHRWTMRQRSTSSVKQIHFSTTTYRVCVPWDWEVTHPRLQGQDEILPWVRNQRWWQWWSRKDVHVSSPFTTIRLVSGFSSTNRDNCDTA